MHYDAPVQYPSLLAALEEAACRTGGFVHGAGVSIVSGAKDQEHRLRCFELIRTHCDRHIRFSVPMALRKSDRTLASYTGRQGAPPPSQTFLIRHTGGREISYSAEDFVFSNKKILPLPLFTYLCQAFAEDSSRAVDKVRARFVAKLFTTSEAYQGNYGLFNTRDSLFQTQIRDAHSLFLSKLTNCQTYAVTK